MKTGWRPNLSKLRVFGCHAEVYIERHLRDKSFSESGDHSRSSIFLGYCKLPNSYAFYIPQLKWVVTQQDAAFNEGHLPRSVGKAFAVSISGKPA